MKIAFAGKGGVGKTTLTAWTAHYLAQSANNMWLIDADTALSLGQALGLSREQLPVPLIQRKDLVEERMGQGILRLNPELSDLPEQIAVDVPTLSAGHHKLLLMGTVTNAGGGCACGANALLKALLSHIVLDRNEWTLIDLEAGVEHLGRGTIAGVDALVIVSEPSQRGFHTAVTISDYARELGLTNQLLMLNRCPDTQIELPPGLPELQLKIPIIPGLVTRQLSTTSVLNLPEQWIIDNLIGQMLSCLSSSVGRMATQAA